jgi:hypothetical protein
VLEVGSKDEGWDLDTPLLTAGCLETDTERPTPTLTSQCDDHELCIAAILDVIAGMSG